MVLQVWRCQHSEQHKVLRLRFASSSSFIEKWASVDVHLISFYCSSLLGHLRGPWWRQILLWKVHVTSCKYFSITNLDNSLKLQAYKDRTRTKPTKFLKFSCQILFLGATYVMDTFCWGRKCPYKRSAVPHCISVLSGPMRVLSRTINIVLSHGFCWDNFWQQFYAILSVLPDLSCYFPLPKNS